jgi:hypothetical protein
MAWIAAAGGVIKLIEMGMNLVERSKTTAKGGDKADLAMQFASALGQGGCQGGTDPFQAMSNELEEAIKAYQSAYVTLQNVLAKEGRSN